MTFIEANVLKLKDRIVIENHYDSVIDYLSEHYPNGFGEKNCTISVNGIEQKIENYDVILADDATIVLMFHPAVAIVGAPVLSFIANLLIGAAVSFVVGQIFRPKIPELQTSLSSRNKGQASSVYSLNSQQNEAKIGAVIPIIYGKIRTYPALIASPYYRYEDNEEYLYQLMCIGQGKYDINKMLISDTDTIEIQSDYFRYEKLEYDDFKTVAGIAAKVNDSEYKGLVKTIPDIDNLELRGTPQNKSMIMRFENSTITFFPYIDGTKPDLSSLSNGSTITISDTISNNGVFTVDSVLDNVVTVQAHTFTTEPNKELIGTEYISAVWSVDDKIAVTVEPFVGYYFTANAGEVYSVDAIHTIYIGGEAWSPAEISGTDILSLKEHALTYKAQFDTSYGSFSYDKEHIGFEVDIVYPNGVYNTDTAGEFTARDTVSNIILNNTNISNLTKVVTTSGELDNSAIRITYKYIYADNAYAALQPNMSLNFKRITAEPSDIKSMDKTYIARVKFILEEKNYEPLGDLTLLWCKIRASNAISSIGQFAINAWVTRNDVNNDVKEVITDVYTNDVYGGRLPATDLDLDDTSYWGEWTYESGVTYTIITNVAPSVYLYQVFYDGNIVYNETVPFPVGSFIGFGGGTYEVDTSTSPDLVRKFISNVVNGAIDSKMTLFDAMQMIGKSNRYTVFPVGNDIKLKHDAAKPIRTTLYNETNIIKDSLKISYLFEEVDETDSVKVTYRDSTEFKEVTAIYPSNGAYPEELELWGCTSESVALGMATYLYKQDRARRKSVEFKTDIQGLIPQFLDRIAISHNMPNWGLGGQIVSVSGNNITLDCDFDLISKTLECDDKFDCLEVFCKVNNFDTIMFRDEVGGVSDAYTFSVVGAKEIQLTSTPPTWLNTSETFDNTFFSIGAVDSVVKDYIVTSVKPNGEQITIVAVNYDDSIYS